MPAGMGVAQAIIYIRAVDMVTRPLTGMSRSVARFGMAISQIGLAMSAAISFPVAAAIKGIASASVEFDKQQRQFQSISKQSDAQIAQLSERLLNMSTDIRQTIAPATELSKAMYEIQSASFTAAEAEKVLQVSTKLASATLSDQDETAATLATVINSYGRNMSKVGEYADIMARGIDIGVFKMGDLNASLGEVTSLAYDLGVPFAELIATLTTMTKKGVGFSESVTSMRRVMMAYLKPAQKEIELGKKYGIVLSGNTIRTKGLAGAIEELVKNTGGNVDVMANIIGEMRAIRGVMAIGTGGGLDMVARDMLTLGNAAGTVQQIYEIMSKSIQFQIDNLKNKFNALAIRLGAVVIPMLVQVIEVISRLVDRFARLPGPTQEFIIKMGILLAVVGPALILFGQLITFASGLAAVFGGLSSALLALGAPIIVMVGMFEAWKRKGSEVREIMDKLRTQPGFLGGVMQALTTVFETLEKVKFSLVPLKEQLESTWAVLTQNKTGEIDWVLTLAESLKFVAQVAIVIPAIFETILIALKMLETIFTSVFTSVGDKMRAWGDVIAAVFTLMGANWASVGVQISMSIDAMIEEFNTLKEVLLSIANALGLVVRLMNAVSTGNVLEGAKAMLQIKDAFAGVDTAVTKLRNGPTYEERTRKIYDAMDARSAPARANLDAKVKEMNAIYNTSWDSMVKELKVYGDEFDQLSARTKAQGKAIADLDLAEPLRASLEIQKKALEHATALAKRGVQDESTMETIRARNPKEASMTPAQRLARSMPTRYLPDTSYNPFDRSKQRDNLEGEGIMSLMRKAAETQMAGQVGLSKTMGGLSGAADGASDALDNLKKGIGSVIDKLMDYSESLGDFGLGPGGGNPLTDPNGPFQAIWRIQDVAQHAGAGRSEGPDTKKWAEMYFPGMNMDAAQAAAAEVGRLFKSYQFDKIAQFLGPGWEQAVVSMAPKDGSTVPPALQALIDQIAANAQSGATSGTGTITPPMGKAADATKLSESALLKLAAGDVTPEGVKSIIDPAMPVLVTGLKDAIARNEVGIRDTGKDFWKSFGEGITKQAETDGNLRKVVEAIVISLLGEKD